MSPVERAADAKAFARVFRRRLVTRASKRAVRRLGRSLTDGEARVIRITVRTMIPPAPVRVDWDEEVPDTHPSNRYIDKDSEPPF